MTPTQPELDRYSSAHTRTHPYPRPAQPRVLLYTHGFPPSVGGMETVAVNLAGGLTRAGLTVTVMTDTPRRLGDDRDAYPFGVVRRPTRTQLFRLVQSADLVHLNGFDLPTFLVARAFGRPIAWSHHDYGPTACARPGVPWCGPLHLGPGCPVRKRGNQSPMAHRLKDYVRQFVHLAALHAVELNVVALPGHVPVFNFPRTLVIPVGVHAVSGTPQRKERPLVVFAGRHVAGKGGDVLIRAVGRLPRNALDLVIAGDGPERESWQELAASLGIRARFLGALSWEHIRPLFLQSDVVVVPTAYAEYFGVVALEAMSCGAFVVASNTGGLAEIVETCGGATFSAGDDQALAEQLQRLLTGRQALTASAELSRRCVLSRHSLEAAVAQHIQMYRRLVARGRATGLHV